MSLMYLIFVFLIVRFTLQSNPILPEIFNRSCLYLIRSYSLSNRYIVNTFF